MDRRDCLFCWTEPAAQHVDIIQRVLVTCCRQGVHPSTCLVDELQRVYRYPGDPIEGLTPRGRKQHFADNPLTSDIGAQSRHVLVRSGATWRRRKVKRVSA